MNVVVTCGPSCEPIDNVRRITNFSTGRLGATLCKSFNERGWRVYCYKGEGATWPGPWAAHQIHSFSINEQLHAQLAQLSLTERIDAVFHAAALCDFKVSQVKSPMGEVIQSRKFSTREGNIQLELTPAAKILPLLRDWFPKAYIAGWKYEAEGAPADALRKVWMQIRECRTDAGVLNGPAYGPGFAFCRPPDTVVHCADALALGDALVQAVSTGKLP